MKRWRRLVNRCFPNSCKGPAHGLREGPLWDGRCETVCAPVTTASGATSRGVLVVSESGSLLALVFVAIVLIPAAALRNVPATPEGRRYHHSVSGSTVVVSAPKYSSGNEREFSWSRASQVEVDSGRF